MNAWGRRWQQWRRACPDTQRRLLLRCGVPLVALLLGLLLGEAAAQVYVRHVARLARMFVSDPVLGWKCLPNLDLTRVNPDGELWTIRTDARGQRGPAAWRAGVERRVLILGDSFAFGMGVNLEDRFDTLMARRRPDWAFVNLGANGYGTDQALIAGRPFADGLQRGDALVLLTFWNDFPDILRRAYSNRSKPWFELDGSRLVEHPPRVNFLHWLRDHSYLIAECAARLHRTRHDFPLAELRQSLALFTALVQAETHALRERGVHVVLAHHGDAQLVKLTKHPEPYARVCRTAGLHCLPLDPALARTPDAFQKDRHWSKAGNAAVADTLGEFLDRLAK